MFHEMHAEEEIPFHLQLTSLVPAGEKKLYLSLLLICTETYGKDCNIPVGLNGSFVEA